MKRLEACLEFIKGHDFLIDVGSDHAYLPIMAIEKNYVSRAIASDVNLGPVNNAKKNIKDLNLDNKIEVLKYDGIPPNDCDVLNISGMGGELMVKILDSTLKNAKNLKSIVLAPNTDCYLVRKYLSQNGYRIVDENIIFYRHYYEIIKFEKGSASYSQDELYLGPILMKKRSNVFIEKYTKLLNHLENIKKNINDSLRLSEINNEIDIIKNNLKDLL